VPQVQAYFGMVMSPELDDLLTVPEVYDARVAEALEVAFG